MVVVKLSLSSRAVTGIWWVPKVLQFWKNEETCKFRNIHTNQDTRKSWNLNCGHQYFQHSDLNSHVTPKSWEPSLEKIQIKFCSHHSLRMFISVFLFEIQISKLSQLQKTSVSQTYSRIWNINLLWLKDSYSLASVEVKMMWMCLLKHDSSHHKKLSD